MKVDWNATLAGLRMMDVRDAIAAAPSGATGEIGVNRFSVDTLADILRQQTWRKHVDEQIALGRIEKRLRASHLKNMHGKFVAANQKLDRQHAAKAKKLIAALLRESYIIPTKDRGGIYKTTTKANALKMAKAVKRMDRATAEALVKGVLERACDINKRKDLLVWVTEIRAFGSYITDAQELGDVDLAGSYLKRIKGQDWTTLCRAFARANGKNLDALSGMFSYPEKVVKMLLKNRSPRISLHDMEDLERGDNWPSKLIYRWSPPMQRKTRR
ncbi:MAG: hypothetical protein NTV56_19300 [Alphaproteobacteria bacterium]|nr:hypothetical protein [Alphaproteobacteria bacterium]